MLVLAGLLGDQLVGYQQLDFANQRRSLDFAVNQDVVKRGIEPVLDSYQLEVWLILKSFVDSLDLSFVSDALGPQKIKNAKSK